MSARGVIVRLLDDSKVTFPAADSFKCDGDGDLQVFIGEPVALFARGSYESVRFMDIECDHDTIGGY